jgi:hypothetical protein
MSDSTAELRFFKRYAYVSTALTAILGLAAFTNVTQQKQKFGEIDVERINIVEPDGKLRMVISNRPRSIGPIYKGKPFGYPGGGRPGMIFFNDEGTENGGMGFSGQRMPDGTFRANSQLAFDQFDQDQILYLSYSDNNGNRQAGLTVADRAVVSIYDVVMKRDSIMKAHPEGQARNEALARLMGPVNGVPMQAQRVYVGRDRAKTAMVNLSDPQGKIRLRMLVDSLGAARIEFLDANGTVTSRIPSGD